MSNEHTLLEIRAISRRLLPDTGAHDFQHAERVAKLCERIGKTENANLFVLEIAAYLHDITRAEEDACKGKICHAETGAIKTQEILEPFSILNEHKQNIIHCIRTHRFRDGNRPETIEAKILYDSDKLDVLGAVGVARCYWFSGERKAHLHCPLKDVDGYSKYHTAYREYAVKISKLKDKLFTREAQKIAKGRHKFMESFFMRFLEELEGNL